MCRGCRRRRDVIVVERKLDEPVNDGEKGMPGVRSSGGFEGRFVELEGAIKVFEEKGKIFLEFERGPVEASEDKANGVSDVFGRGERGFEDGGEGLGGEVGVDDADGGGLMDAIVMGPAGARPIPMEELEGRLL
uniref:Uncharacterized protein n=1 Tax=Nelumbo nucifera TaxID=4432 RepID=A0A822XVS3_NELNU|nr:TPA_asm: hypothetical protein HUJ06_025905 [Nelumbo nucifera]